MTRAPMRLADLDRGKPDAASCAEHQQGLTGLQPTAVDQRMDRRGIGHQQRRAFFEAAFSGQRDRALGGHHDLLRKAAEAEGGDQPVAG